MVVIAVAAGAIYLSWYLAGSTSGQSIVNRSAGQAVSAPAVIPPTTEPVVATFPTSTSPDENTGSGTSLDTQAHDAVSPQATGPALSPQAESSGLALEAYDDDLTSYSGQAVTPLLKSSNRQAIDQRQVGLYEYRSGREPLARFIAHDGMLVTCASALAGRRDLTVWDLDGWVAASVVAVDSISDIAVLEPESWSEQFDVMARTIEPGSNTLVRKQTVAVRETTDLAGMDGSGDDIDNGTVIGVAERVVHKGSHALYDAALTTIDFRPTLAGGRLLDDRNRTVGMIVNGTSYTVTAIPVDSVLAIARSLRATGEPSPSWIGLETMTDDNGAARVVSVDPDGPAADVVTPGDIIETWNGQPVFDADHLVHHVRQTPASSPIEIGLRHRGRPLQATVVPAPTAVSD